MIDLDKEKLITLTAAQTLVPGEEFVDRSTLHRWAIHGVKTRSGKLVYLEYMVGAGRKLLTSVEALKRFVIARSELSLQQRQQQPPEVIVNKTRPKPGEMSPAQRELLAMGIGTDPNAPKKQRRRREPT